MRDLLDLSHVGPKMDKTKSELWNWEILNEQHVATN